MTHVVLRGAGNYNSFILNSFLLTRSDAREPSLIVFMLSL